MGFLIMYILKDVVREGDKFSVVEDADWHKLIAYFLNSLSVLKNRAINDII